MNSQAYIQSGILELYAMGQLEAIQAAEVEQYARMYPEIRAELDRIEAALEELAQAQAVAPSATTWEELAAKLGPDNPTVETPRLAPDATARASTVPGWVWLALALLSAMGLWFWWQQNTATQALRQSEQQLESLQRDCAATSQLLQQATAELTLLRDPASRLILLEGTANSPTSRALAAYNADKQQLYLLTSELPEMDSDQQLQSWAIVDGKPVSLGMLERGATANIISLKLTEAPQAFAISLEPLGGSEQPTPTGILVLGAIPGDRG